jgi:hypothetical protein
VSNPVVTHHRVKIYLVESEWPGCKEIVIEAAFEPDQVRTLPGIVVTDEDRRQLVDLLGGRSGDTAMSEDLKVWKNRVVDEACERNGVTLRDLVDPRRKRTPAVSKARAQAVRILAKRFAYEEAGELVGISDHASVYYWVKGKGKDKHK